MRSIGNFKLPSSSRKTLSVFGGYDHNPVIGDGEFYDMKNMTGDLYPVASVRKRREEQLTELTDGTPVEDAVAILGRDDYGFSILDNGDIYCGGSSAAHKISGLLQTDYTYTAAETHTGTVSVTLTSGTFIAKVGSVAGTYQFFCEPGGWTDDDENAVTLSEYGLTVTGETQGDTITVTVSKVPTYIPQSMLPKQLVSMGAWVLIWPDKVYVNAVKLGNGDTMVSGTDYGHIDNEVTITSPAGAQSPVLYIKPCTEDGTTVTAEGYGKTSEIENPSDGDYVCCLEDRQWYKYYDATEEWSAVNIYALLQADGIAQGFQAGDYVQIAKGDIAECFELPGSDTLADGESRRIVGTVSTNKIILDAFWTGNGEAANDYEEDVFICTIKRSVPQLDYVVECGNRLWGCFYGMKNGEHINEIYASKLGDFKNWNVFAGISTDSYVASRGSDGKYTGAAVLGGYPLFFRERSFEKVYPSTSGAHQIVTVSYPGIQSGSRMSAKVCEGVLYYKGTDGIYAYSGSVPKKISSALGDTQYYGAVAGILGRKYYVSMHDSAGNDSVFVYDTEKGLWHKEDAAEFKWAEQFKNKLYFLDGNNTAANTQCIGSYADCTDVPWMMETGDIGLTTPDAKRISRLALRLRLEIGAEAEIAMQYNSDGIWHTKQKLHGNCLASQLVPIVPIRCDTVKIRLSGIGGMELFSVAYTLEQGSDVP